MNPFYNDIHYNSKIRYNVNLVCTKISESCIFHWYSHFILQENICFVYLLELPRRGDSNKYTKHIIYKKKCPEVSVFDALDGSYQVSLQQQIWFDSKIFGNKQGHYNQGPL